MNRRMWDVNIELCAGTRRGEVVQVENNVTDIFSHT